MKKNNILIQMFTIFLFLFTNKLISQVQYEYFDIANISTVLQNNGILDITSDMGTGFVYPNAIDVNENEIKIRYECNMEIEILSGRFNPALDYVELRGTKFGWLPQGVRMQQDLQNPNIYYYEDTQTYSIPGDNIGEYKFWYSNNNFWESGLNKTYTITQQDIDNGQININRFFDDLNFDKITNYPCTILFSVNIKDGNDLNGNPIVGPITNVHLSGSISPLSWQWFIDNTESDLVRMYDDATHGDKVSNDGIYTNSVTFGKYTPFEVQYGYVINIGLASSPIYENQYADNHIIHLEKDLIGAIAENTYGYMSSVTGITELKEKVYSDARQITEITYQFTTLSTKINDNKISKNIAKAFESFKNSLNSDYWIDENHLAYKEGTNVFEEMKNAADNLENILKDKNTDQFLINSVHNIINYIVPLNKNLALTAINDAQNNNPDEKVIKSIYEANKNMADAEAQLIKCKYSEAIDKYKQAWQDATKDMKKELKKTEDFSNGNENAQTKNSQTIPTEYSISQNFPNPFNPSTIIRYDIPQESFVSIKIYDILGREVTTLVNEKKPVGRHQVTFNAKNLSSGIYFYTIKAGDFLQTKKLMLLK